MQPAPQNKRRLSLVSNGRYEGSISDEAVSGKPAAEGPQPRVYTISREPALLPGSEAEAIELAVVKGRRQRERHPHHHSQPLRASPGSSHEDVSRPCQSWAGSRQGSRECPGCAQLGPGPSPRAFGLEQPPLPEVSGRHKKLERMCSVDGVSGEGLIFGPGQVWGFLLACSSSRHCKAGYPGTIVVRTKTLQSELTSSPKSCELWSLSDGKQTYHSLARILPGGRAWEDLEDRNRG